MSKATMNQKYEKPAHGSVVTFDDGGKVLFLDNGTFRGMWLSPNSSACILANLAAVQTFSSANPVKPKEPKAARKVEAKSATADDVRAQIAKMQETIAKLAASAAAPQAGRLDPSATTAPAAA
jgi:hypothetical protein